jgi:Tfp pilus assembly protein PilV
LRRGDSRRARAAGARAGFTLVEVGLALTVLVIAVVAVSATTARSHALRRQTRERALAQNAVRTMAEQIQALARRTIAESPESWSQDLVAALSAGGALGSTFEVRELTPAADGAPVGTIEVVTDERATDAALGVPLGLPRDLDGDGAADDPDVADEAHLLPVVLRARWRGVRGEARLVHGFWVVGF